MSTVGLTNDQVMNLLLCSREENAVIEIEYSLPDYREFDSMIDDRELIFDSYHPRSIAKQLVRHDEVGTGDR